jgi:hypothetical protein
MIFFDTETCGLHGMPVLIQWAEDDGPIQLYCPWVEPIEDTLRLIERFCDTDVCAFNIAFDWFHICKLYTVLSQYHDWSVEPIEIINDLADLEMQARDGLCCKPKSALDLMLFARKGPYQSTMARSDIRIRRVPTPLAWQLAAELEKRIPLPDIYFARRKDKHAQKWQVFDVKNREGDIVPEFKDIVLRFKASSALKALATDALKLPADNVLLFSNIGVDKAHNPSELGYAPFAKAMGGDRKDWKGAWPEKIKAHISHWRFHETARKYAADDVEYLRRLYEHFGRPETGDDDSTLACMIAACRWRGYAVDVPGLQKLRDDTLNRRFKNHRGEQRLVPTSPRDSRRYIEELMDETEKLGCSVDGFNISTSKIILEKAVKKWKRDCPECAGGTKPVVEGKDCGKCKGSGEITHPAAYRADEVLKARQAQYEADLYDKFILAGRFHASFAVIGALSSRMGGGGTGRGIESGGKAKGDGLNPQGIKKTKEVREKFPLAFPGYKLSGGDFSAFEVTLAEAEYNDPNLRTQLLTCEMCSGRLAWVPERISANEYLGVEGHILYVAWRIKAEAKKAKKSAEDVEAGKSKKLYTPKSDLEIAKEHFENDFHCQTCGSTDGKKIHALFGIHVYPQHTYESLKATSGTPDDLYTRAKSAVFAMMYGGTEHTLVERLAVPLEVALAALARFHKEFPGVKRSQQRITDLLSALRQVGGIGTKVEYTKPADYIESMFGFRRYFTLENQILKALFDLAAAPPREWKRINVQVQRRDRFQTAFGALQSALYGAAYAIQAGSIRAANNHVIQSSGATVTKEVQRNIWNLQPHGVHKFYVQPMNVHDEIQCPCLPELVDKVAAIVKATVESMRPKVPLIRMDWQKECNSWADKS